MGEVATDLDTIDQGGTPPPEDERPGRQRKPPETDHEETPPADPNKPPADKGGKKQGDGKPADAPPAEKEPTGLVEIRKAYREAKKDISERLQPEIQRLTARVQELETAQPAEPDITKNERFVALQNRNQELEKAIGFLDYQQSTEFQTKYQKPYQEAYARALRDIKQMEVEQGGNSRPATEEDLLGLANMPLGAARKAANSLFGDSADEVMYHVRNLKDLAEKQYDALEEAKSKAADDIKTAETNRTAQNAQRIRVWNDANKGLATKFPALFAPIQGDTEGNLRLQKGFALADVIFRGAELTPDEIKLLPSMFQQDLLAKKPLSMEKQVRLHALIRNKVANHDRLVYKLNSTLKELADAKKALKEFEDSAPPVDGRASDRGRRSASGKNWQDEANAEIDALNNPNLH